MDKKNKGFEIVNSADGKVVDLFCTGYIGTTAWKEYEDLYFGVKNIKNSLDSIKKADEVNIYINSFGGSFFEGMAMYNLLKEYEDKITTHVVGSCMSAAVLVLLAGKTRIANTGSIVMVHEPSTYAEGNSSDLRRVSDELDKFNKVMIDVYEQATNYEREKLENMVAEETYLDAEEAVEFGFATEQSEEKVAAMVVVPSRLANVYKKLPDNLKEKEEPTIRDAERALRDAGFTNKEAKEIASKGFKSTERDVPEEDEKQADIKAQLEKINSMFR